MSTVKTNNVQIGQSATATNNFTWYQPASPDGTVRLGNGNAGAVTDAVTVTSAGNVGIGTSSPLGAAGYGWLTVNGSSDSAMSFSGGNTEGFRLQYDSGTAMYVNTIANIPMLFKTNDTERMRITSGGDVLVNATATSDLFDGKLNVAGRIHIKDNVGPLYIWNPNTTGNNFFVAFLTETAGTARGSIYYNRGTGQIVYGGTSDYRAKDILGPVADAGATIDALKVYTGQMHGATMAYPMMVAHEAQEVVPFAVSGEKDAVNEDGTPKMQTMDHAILVPLLIAELQSVRARLAALEAK